MAKANDYVLSEKRCRVRAERSSGEQIRQAWLNLAESYSTLLTLDKMENDDGAMIGSKRPA